MSSPAHPQGHAASGLWPTADQLLVLKASLGKGEDALAAFRAWVGRINIDGDFDLPTFRLLPLLYHNLNRLGVRHPLMGRLKGAYRLVWYKNHTLFDRLRPTIAAIVDAGIPTMLLKGVPLVLNEYGNGALRPMADIDIQVPYKDAPRTVQLLIDRGWQPYAAVSSDLFRYRQSLGMGDGKESEIDVHWHSLFELSRAGEDSFLWASAQPCPFLGVATLAPDPTRHLIVTLLHGVRWNPEPPIRWIPDAIMILRKSSIAWEELLAFARERHLSYRLWLGLAYLVAEFDAPVPESVVDGLARDGVSLVERVENTVVLKDRTPLHATPFGNLWIIFAEYVRYGGGRPTWRGFIGFTHYLRYRWHLRGRMEIPGVLWHGTMRRLAGGKADTGAALG